jgi:hypothetical protein
VGTYYVTGQTRSSLTPVALINPEGKATTYKCEYGTTTALGSETSAQSAGSGTSAVAETCLISGLASAENIYFRFSAHNEEGTATNNDANSPT